MEALDFLISQLGISYKLLIKKDRHMSIVKNRYVVVFFYLLMGYNKCQIGRILKKDRFVVYQTLKKADEDAKLKAQELYDIYTGKIKPEPEKVVKLVPDYKHSRMELKEFIK